ncbi:hypothetical protein N7603_01935 [Acholeplasma vituli]|uniref:Uncharacterized protein n=1 Tax=Paracholeplasma vituli TaxID=69473 RepID=A0ABT2PU00_9MOLU|nr:hypothetical protein [Paracholeplasma vituli]MCU0104414.1 hypothetical protein [Paracholeplasma vituli]
MAKLIYTTRKSIVFNSLSEVYETIGILTSGKYTMLKIEQNQLSGAWGKEGRIIIYSSPHKFPKPISDRYSAGNGRILYRVNSNAFVLDMISNHGFTIVPITSTGKTANVNPPSYIEGLSFVPSAYQADFTRGYNK